MAEKSSAEIKRNTDAQTREAIANTRQKIEDLKNEQVARQLAKENQTKNL